MLSSNMVCCSSCPNKAEGLDRFMLTIARCDMAWTAEINIANCSICKLDILLDFVAALQVVCSMPDPG